MKALVGAFNREKALLGAFSVHCETLRRFVDSSTGHAGYNVDDGAGAGALRLHLPRAARQHRRDQPRHLRRPQAGSSHLPRILVRQGELLSEDVLFFKVIIR